MVATAVDVRNMIFSSLAKADRPRRPVPKPMRSPTPNLVLLVLNRSPQVCDTQSTPDGAAKARAMSSCEVGLRRLNPNAYTRDRRRIEEK
jgi:hypothetical protein